ncbi:MAG: peptidylprolyl isomerase [Dehalococcoidia bacterium]
MRWAILGGVALIVVVALGLFGYRWYQANFVRPEKVVLHVGTTEVKLEYYADRLYQFLVANPSTSTSTGSQALLRELEAEELNSQYAQAQGVDLSASAVTAFMAEEFGADLNSTGFESSYRAALRRTGWSDSTYRREAAARMANAELLELLEVEVGDTGELLDFRAVVVADEESAQDVFDRVEGGEDLGLIAQVESLDLTSRQNDGLIENQTTETLQDELALVLGDAAEGALLGPVQAGNNWWVLRVEGRDPEGEYTDAQKAQIARARLAIALEEFRATILVRQDFTGSDYDWALQHTTVVDSPGVQ